MPNFWWMLHCIKTTSALILTNSSLEPQDKHPSWHIPRGLDLHDWLLIACDATGPTLQRLYSRQTPLSTVPWGLCIPMLCTPSGPRRLLSKCQPHARMNRWMAPRVYRKPQGTREHTVKLEGSLSQGIAGKGMDQALSSGSQANGVILSLNGFSWVPHNPMILETFWKCLKKKNNRFPSSMMRNGDDDHAKNFWKLIKTIQSLR